MKTLRNFVTLVTAHALCAGCAAEVLPSEAALLDDDGDTSGAQVTTAGGLWHGDEPVVPDGIEQWLRIVNLETDAPADAVCLCAGAYHATETPACSETDSLGQLVTHWTPVDQTYRMLGTSDDGIKFMLQDVADIETINRLERPIRVLNREQLKAYYGRALTKLNPGRHTVVARARVGNLVADAVRFELHPLETDETRLRLASYPDANGLLSDLLISSSLGQAVFLDVMPGSYELRAERNGQPCGSAEIWLDGLIEQFVAPELACE